MKYSKEFKLMCVELYRQGKWAETPAGIEQKEFRHKIRKWFRIEEACGAEALERKRQNTAWTAEEKYELVAKVLAGNSIRGTAFSAGISEGLLYQWVKRYKMTGYEGLVAQRKGRPPKEPAMKKSCTSRTDTIRTRRDDSPQSGE